MPEGAVFGPYDRPVKMDRHELVTFLRTVRDCVDEDDSMEGCIAYEWSAEPGVYNVAAFVRNGNSQGQGGAWVLQDTDTPVPEAPQVAEADDPVDGVAPYNGVQ
jgi:hypothetical protein